MSATVGEYYTGGTIPRELAEQVVALAPTRGVLDPACGDGRLLDAVRELLPDIPLYGMDRNPTAVEACRAKGYQASVGDALFDDLPDADVWIANPPYLGGLKISGALGQEYRKRLKKQWPDVHGNADYCVYWLRRAHDLPGVRAVVGVYTNTIAQGDTRRSGLRFLLVEGGWEIFWAWRRRKWQGDKAAVVVSLVGLRRCIPWVDVVEPEPTWKGWRAAPWDASIPGQWTRRGAATVERAFLAYTLPLYPYRWSAMGSDGGWADSPDEGMRLADDHLAAAGWILEGVAP